MAYQFNGSSQYLTTASAPVTAEPVTLAAWINLSSLAGFGEGDTILALDNAVSFSSLRLQVIWTGAVRAAVVNDTPSGVVATTTDLVSTGSWNFVAAVFSSTSSRHAFLNKSKSPENTTSLSMNTTPNRAITGAVCDPNYTPPISQYADGSIAEAAIWNVALTDAELASLASGFTPSQVRPQSLQFYAPLVRDLSDVRGGRVITNNNTATVANHPRIIT